jgi:hypothetical protein
MTDKELLELAANAAGYDVVDVGTTDRPAMRFRGDTGNSQRCYFNPLTDDGDALRLAVKLGMAVEISNRKLAWASSESLQHVVEIKFDESTDPYAATRRAIVRAAAAIGATK